MKMTGLILMVSGSILLLVGLILFNLPTKTEKLKVTNPEVHQLRNQDIQVANLKPKEKDDAERIAVENSLKLDKRIADIENKLKKKGTESKTEQIDDNKKIGDDFEKFIVKKFNLKYYKIKDWTGDKYIDGVYAETSTNPDLLIELKKNNVLFAVECKWRKIIYDGGINFANPEQLKRYIKYASEKGIPVFIAVGIGGTSSDPKHLYIVPLEHIDSTFLSISFLKTFEMKIEKPFFFNPVTVELQSDY